jgi:hypothetical protein
MKKSITVFVWVAVCFVAAVFVPAALSLVRDRPVADLLTVILQGEGTTYSDAYSERAFQKIKTGMTESQVRGLLGTPLKIIEASKGRIKRMVIYSDDAEKIIYPDLPAGAGVETNELVYYYSQPQTATSDWFIRAVTFTRDGTVVKITRELYVD